MKKERKFSEKITEKQEKNKEIGKKRKKPQGPGDSEIVFVVWYNFILCKVEIYYYYLLRCILWTILLQ